MFRHKEVSVELRNNFRYLIFFFCLLVVGVDYFGWGYGHPLSIQFEWVTPYTEHELEPIHILEKGCILMSVMASVCKSNLWGCMVKNQ